MESEKAEPAEASSDVEQQSSFYRLPNEIFLLIADTMDVRDIATFARANRFFHNLINPVLYSTDAKHGKSSALAFAASKGLIDTARFSISKGGNPNAQRGNILFSAIQNHDNEMVQILLEGGADPDGISTDHDHGGLPPLLWLLRPPSPGLYESYPNRTLGLRSVFNDYSEIQEHRIREASPILKTLLEYNPDINGADEYDCTALHFAANFGCHELAEDFIAKGADIEAQDLHGHTPLFRAVLNNYLETAQVLLTHNANIEDSPGARSQRLLLLAIHFTMGQPDNKMTKLLLEHGADPRVRGRNEDTILHEVARLGDAELARRLIEMGVDVNQMNRHHETPLHIAAVAQHVPVIELILKNDPDPHCRSVFERIDPMDYDKGQALNCLAAKGLDGKRLAEIARHY